MFTLDSAAGDCPGFRCWRLPWIPLPAIVLDSVAGACSGFHCRCSFRIPLSVIAWTLFALLLIACYNFSQFDFWSIK